MRIAPTVFTAAAAAAATTAVVTAMTTTRTAGGLSGIMRTISPCRVMMSNDAARKRAARWSKAGPASATATAAAAFTVATADRRRLTTHDRHQHHHGGRNGIRSGWKLFASADQQHPARKRRCPSPSSPDAGAAKLHGARKSASVVVLASGSKGEGGNDELERCYRLADELGAALMVGGEGEAGGGGGEDDRRRGRGTKSNAHSDGVGFTMLFDESGRLALGQPGSGFTPLVVDFSGGTIGHRAKHQQGTEHVVKAAALPRAKRRVDRPHPTSSSSSSSSSNKDVDVSIAEEQEGDKRGGVLAVEGGGSGDGDLALPLLWDLTAGLGTDSFMLASAGWRVKMFERSPVVAALVQLAPLTFGKIQDALDRARVCDDDATSAAASRMSLTVADSTDVVAEDRATEKGDGRERPAVVYLDPMFPHKKKSALVKKGMQMLQGLLLQEEGGGGDDDGDSDVVGSRAGEERRLFDGAMRLATRKVVVKRPVHGAAIVGHVAPSHAVVSKNGRFDVYIVSSS